MIYEIILMILFLLSFILLVYGAVILIKRKEYENKRIFVSYNLMIFGVLILSFAMLIKSLKLLLFVLEIYLENLIYLDFISNVILIPLFGISLLVSMLNLREV